MAFLNVHHAQVRSALGQATIDAIALALADPDRRATASADVNVDCRVKVSVSIEDNRSLNIRATMKPRTP